MCLQIKFYWVRICTALHRQSWITERGKLCKYKIFPTGLLREKFAGLQFNYTCSGPKLSVSGSQPALTGFMRFSKCLTYPCLSFLIHKMKKVRGLPDRTLWDYMNHKRCFCTENWSTCPSILSYIVLSICNMEGKMIATDTWNPEMYGQLLQKRLCTISHGKLLTASQTTKPSENSFLLKSHELCSTPRAPCLILMLPCSLPLRQ